MRSPVVFFASLVLLVGGATGAPGLGSAGIYSCNPIAGSDALSWPYVKHPTGIVGKTAQALLDSIIACADAIIANPATPPPVIAAVTKVKNAATQRKTYPYHHDNAPGHVVTTKQGWAKVAVAWRLFQAAQYAECEAQLLGAAKYDHMGAWGTTETYSPDSLGSTMLDTLEARLHDPIYAAPPAISMQLHDRFDVWKVAPAANPKLKKVNAYRWARVVAAYYAAGLGGDPNWYLCLDEIKHCP